MSRRQIIYFAIVVVLVLIPVLRYAYVQPPPSQPSVPATLNATGTLRTVEYDEIKALIPNAPHSSHGQLILGRIGWDRPADSRGRFEVLVIDKRSHHKPYEMVKLVPGFKQSGMVKAPWYVLDKVEEKYPWLRGAADVRDGDKIKSGSPSSLSVLPHEEGITFVALFAAPGYPSDESHKYWATAPVNPDWDILVALVHIGDDGEIYSAERIYG